MKSKRFIDEIVPRKIWRKLSLESRNTFIYLWFNCDESGVYEIDEDQFNFDNGYELNLECIRSEFSDYMEFSNDLILIKSFVLTNNGTNLRPEYNPHKALFRALEKNNIIISSSNQACFKLVGGGVDVGVDVSGGVDAGGDSAKLETFDLPEDETPSPDIFPPFGENQGPTIETDGMKLWKYYLDIGQFQYSYSSHKQSFELGLDKYGYEKMQKVIELKIFQANKGDIQRSWLAPSTIFRPEKLEKYVNEVNDIEAGRTNPNKTNGKRNAKADALEQAAAELRRLEKMGV